MFCIIIKDKILKTSKPVQPFTQQAIYVVVINNKTVIEIHIAVAM